ncbi:MAG: phenylalanine--tRNA ligase subunit alpha [Candidatus Nanohalobium sp.]
MKLSSQARQVLEILQENPEMKVEEFEEKGFDQSMVNRAFLELEEEGLAEMEEEEEISYTTTEQGEKVLEEGSPEYQIVQELDSGVKPVSEIDNSVGIGKAREKGWIYISDGQASLTDEGEEVDIDPVKDKLENEMFDEELQGRGLVETKEEKTKILKLTEKGKETDLEEIEEDFNVEAQAKTPRTGKKHFFKAAKDYARQVWLEMGFSEMRGDFVTPGIMCFDALYIPQDHPAQDLQDTFYMENPERTDLARYGDYVDRIKEAHESGGETGSQGWQYDWSEELAGKNILRTHTTDVSAKKLIELDEDDLPAKYFIISHAFRNETVDRTHTADFEQAEGIVVGEDLGFAHLKGYLSEFFEKMGYDEFRLIPTYYPYTEMSTEIQVWDEEEEEWLGMGGAGLFRPEVVEPLLGVEATVLAWGLGIARIGAMAAGLSDARNVYRNDIENLQEIPVWRP